MSTRVLRWTACGLAACVAAVAGAQEPGAPSNDSYPRVRLRGEIKLNWRDSRELEFKLSYPFPPDFFPPGEDGVYMKTPAPGSSFELQNVALTADVEWTPGIQGRLVVHFNDLYNRNPTSSGDRVVVREAWALFGKRYDVLQAQPGSSLFLLVGKAPRFTKQLDRRLESYGLWGTAVGRFEQLQVQLGGSLGRFLYWRLHAANPNPLFMRDTNALAGDNGTPEEVPGNVDPIYGSGFPILYDAQAQDVRFGKHWEVGGGAGLRFADEATNAGLDLLGWYFRRSLSDAPHIRGSFYEGDLDMLRGAGIPLPFSGREKVEYGANLHLRAGGLRVFGQLIWQEIAKLKRQGYEVELAYRISLPGLFASGDQPVVNWIQPAVRYSKIDDQFVGPRNFVAPSFFWDWDKLDVGVRVGIIRGIDITAEHERHDMILLSGRKLHPDESLVTLRLAF